MTAYGLLKLATLGSIAMGSAYVLLLRLGTGRWTASAKIAGVLTLIPALIYIDSHFIEPDWIQVRKVKIEDARLAAILDGTRIVQLTDIHINAGLGTRERRLVRLVNRLKPDLILFTGDLVDDLSQVEAAVELFSGMKASLGIYAIPGDTDQVVINPELLAKRLAPAGVTMLLNEARKLPLRNGRELWLAGIDGPRYNDAVMNNTLGAVPPGEPVLLLAHSPDILPHAVRAGVNAVLAGDTHGGQVAVDFLISLSDYANRSPYMRGLFKEGNTNMYVNRGIGMKTLRIRFLCRPEIAVIKFV